MERLPISKLANNTGQIKGVPANPRTIDKDDYQKLLESIQKDPEYLEHEMPHVIAHGDKYVVLNGNQRLRALRELKFTETPVTIYKPDTPPEVIRARIIKSNHGYGKDDMDMLANEWADDDLADWGMDLPDDWLKDEHEVVEDEAPEVDESEPPKSKLGEVYQLGRHRVMCGDSTKDLDELLNGIRPDLVFTDPPYGIDADKMTMGSGAKQFHRGDWDSSKPDVLYLLEIADKVCIWGGNYFTDSLPVTNDWLCWHKKNDNLSFSEFELAWTNYGKNCRHLSHHWGAEKKQHVTMKPIEVCVWGIKQAGDVENVLDTYSGSGSTLIACEQTDRTCYGMELDCRYIDVIIRRFINFTNGEQPVIRLSDGKDVRDDYSVI